MSDGYDSVASAEFCVPSSLILWDRTSTKGQGPVSRKSRELFGPEKPVVKLRPVYSVKRSFHMS